MAISQANQANNQINYHNGHPSNCKNQNVRDVKMSFLPLDPFATYQVCYLVGE